MIKRIRNLSIRFKIALLLSSFALLIISLVSVVLAQQFKNALQDRILLQLSSIRHLKTIQIERILSSHVQEINTMLSHINNSEYLDALAADRFIHIDSIIINHELKELNNWKNDTILIEDISPQINDGKLHLAYHTSHNNLIYTFYSTPQAIQNVLFERTGMGESGETYIVGSDGYLRSQSRFWIDTLPTQIYSKTQAFNLSLKVREGTTRHTDYRNIEVFSSFSSFSYHGLHWVILSEIDVKEALLPLKDMEHRIYIISAIIAIGILILSNFLAWYIVHPVIKVEKALTKISKGEKTNIPRYRNKDEIGSLFSTLALLITNTEQIIDFANHIANSQFNRTMVLRSNNDRLVNSLNYMKDQLIEIQERERQLQNKSQRLLMAGEEAERDRLSKELHDSVGPLLTNLKLIISQNDAPKEVIAQRVQNIIEEVRKISVNLMPSVLKDFGLTAAVQSFIDQLPMSDTCHISYIYDKDEESTIPLNIALNAFRIIQESVNNALKHANATEIKLSITEFTNQVNIFIADNGTGFEPNKVSLGNGLMNIKERVQLFNGHMEIISGNDGTTIEVEFETKQLL
ncbi:sensor histidine kinase [Carboxylicivirga caseinilyticus]|uniref:sensor histidine kinase n=1 Tax=Carboxylicivirga caseinilyticus TaxID=3417572 RepID=UPI003D329406|nr:sensor histidine kinase [Marinilabiliaceae bacterium A049]